MAVERLEEKAAASRNGSQNATAERLAREAAPSTIIRKLEASTVDSKRDVVSA